MSDAAPPPAGTFPSTLWSQVRAAGRSTPDNPALAELCRAYWRPLYAFLRRDGQSPEDAADLVQAFLARLIERGDIGTVAPEHGRFRSYLLAGLRHHLLKEKERAKAQKRGGGKVWNLDPAEAERLSGPDLRGDCDPQQAYDRSWARTLIARALDHLRAEHQARNKEALFEALAPFLEGADAGDYAEVAARLNLRRGTVAVTVNRMRSRLWELLRREAAETVGSPTEAEAELRGVLLTLTQA